MLRIILIIFLLSSLLLAACGGGSGSGGTPTPQAATLQPTAAYKSGVNYTYDNAGRLIQAEYNNGIIIKYVYDKAGNLISQEVKK